MLTINRLIYVNDISMRVINEKHQPYVNTELWCHVCLCNDSNESNIIETPIKCIKKNIPRAYDDDGYISVDGNNLIFTQNAFCTLVLNLCVKCRIKHNIAKYKSDHIAIGVDSLEILNNIRNALNSNKWDDIFKRFSKRKLINSVNVTSKILYKAHKENDGICGRLNDDVLSIIGYKLKNMVILDAVKLIETIWYNKSIKCYNCKMRRCKSKLIELYKNPTDMVKHKVCIDTCSFWCKNKDCGVENYYSVYDINEIDINNNLIYNCWKCFQDFDIMF
jgi:hypothetical protein